MKKIIVFIMFLILTFATIHGVQAYSYNAWGTSTGAKTLALNPFFWGPLKGDFSMTTDLVVLYGFTSKLDVIANLAELTITPETGYALSYVMPRYDLGKNNIFAVQLTAAKGDSLSYTATPQYHFFYENDALALEFNTGTTIPFSTPDNTWLYAIAAPVVKIKKGMLHAFVEVDPSYTLGVSGSFTLNVVPGIWLGLAEGKHQFCLSVPLTRVTSSGGMGITYGAWYWTTFSL